MDVLEMQTRLETLEAHTVEMARYCRELSEAFSQHLAVDHGRLAPPPGSTGAKYQTAVQRQHERRERKHSFRIVGA